MDNYSQRDKAIIIGLFLSKFNLHAIKALGFSTAKEAFNVLGYSLSIKPASLKNYRDEFDHLFPNNRKGWNRNRDYCMYYFAKFGGLQFSDFLTLSKSLLINNFEIEQLDFLVNDKIQNERSLKDWLQGSLLRSFLSKNTVQ